MGAGFVMEYAIIGILWKKSSKGWLDCRFYCIPFSLMR